MKLSLLIPTYLRHRLLEKSLRSILDSKRDGIELELVVVINGPDDRSQTIINESGLNAKIVQTRSVSPSEARNIGLKKCAGDWILFLDDDAYIPTFLFQNFIEITKNSPTISVIGGPNLTPPTSRFFQVSLGKVLQTHLGSHITESRWKSKGTMRECSEESLMLSNLFIKRSELDRLPYVFHPKLICCEENDLLRRISAQGTKLYHSPKLFVFHERRQGPFSLARQVFRYGIGRGQMTILHPKTLKWPHWLPSLCLLYALFFPIFFKGASSHTQIALSLPFICYTLLIFYYSLRIRTVIAPFLYPLIHSCYASGFLGGLGLGSFQLKKEPSKWNQPSAS